MDWWLRNLVSTLALPPASFFVLVGFCLIFLRRLPRLAALFVGVGFIALYLVCTKQVGRWLLEGMSPTNALAPAQILQLPELARPQAIVVVGGGRRMGALEAEKTDLEDLNAQSLERVRYAAYWAKTSGLPLLVSGGKPDGGKWSEAELMAKALEQEWQIPVRWQDKTSNTTAENAANSAALIQSDNIQRIVLISHGWHLPRATSMFARQGLTVFQAPCCFLNRADEGLLDWLPTAEGLMLSRLALREKLGMWFGGTPLGKP